MKFLRCASTVINFMIALGSIIYLMIIKYPIPTLLVVSFGLTLVNVLLLFKKFNAAIIFTGIILIAASFNLLNFFPLRITSSMSLKFGDTKISTPPVQLRSLLLFGLYLLLNFDFLVNLWLDYKERKEVKK